MRKSYIRTTIAMVVLVACSSCGGSSTRRYTDIRRDLRVEAIVPSGPNHGWKKEDMERHAFVAPTNVPPGQAAWTPIIQGNQLTAIEYRRDKGNGSILFCTSDHALLRSMTLTFYDRGPVQYRILVAGDEVAQFEDTIGMGFGKGGYTICLSTTSDKEARRIIRQIRQQ